MAHTTRLVGPAQPGQAGSRQTLAGGTRIDRQTATANMEEKGSKHSEQDKQPSYCQITKLAVYRTWPPARLGGAGSCPPELVATAGRSSATESDVCPPRRCDSHPNRTPRISARLPNRTPSCAHTACHGTHHCLACIVYRLPTTIPHSPPRYLAGKKTASGADGSEDWDYPAEPCSRRVPRVQKSSCLVW